MSQSEQLYNLANFVTANSTAVSINAASFVVTGSANLVGGITGTNPVNTAVTYTWSNAHTFNANVTIGTSARLIANGSAGTSGQTLTSNGTTAYWSTPVVYPSSGIAVSNGTDWSASLTAPAGTIVGTSDSQTLTNKTITNPTVTNYVETNYAPASGTAFTIDLANGTVQKFTSSGNLTLTLPASVAGKSYTIIVAYGGSHTLTWAGGSTIKWAGGTAPTATSTNTKFDIFNFYCDGTNTYGSVYGLNF